MSEIGCFYVVKLVVVSEGAVRKLRNHIFGILFPLRDALCLQHEEKAQL